MGPGVRPLRREDDRSTFRSGDASLDAFFAQYAGQHQFKAHASVTYVVDREDRIAGYATVTAAWPGPNAPDVCQRARDSRSRARRAAVSRSPAHRSNSFSTAGMASAP